MNIKNSLDWSNVNSNLRYIIRSKVKNSENKNQLFKMLGNIDIEITLLSKAEVLARRAKRQDETSLLLTKINQDIQSVEEFITVAILMD